LAQSSISPSDSLAAGGIVSWTDEIAFLFPGRCPTWGDSEMMLAITHFWVRPLSLHPGNAAELDPFVNVNECLVFEAQHHPPLVSSNNIRVQNYTCQPGQYWQLRNPFFHTNCIGLPVECPTST